MKVLKCRNTIFCLSILLFLFTTTYCQIIPFNASDMRIENEDKLVVSDSIKEEVWKFMLAKFVNDKSYIKSLDQHLTSYWYDERFKDTYFDTPELTMFNKKSGIRYRRRKNITNPDDRKSGRELMQIKVNNIDENEMNRGEIKFDIEKTTSMESKDDRNPAIGIVKNDDRATFKHYLTQLGVDVYRLTPIFTIKQRRRSIYMPRNGEQFISIRFDECSARLLWLKWSHIEIEPEINELPYTRASADERRFMEKTNEALINSIKNEFPSIYRDLTPKYNKASAYFISKLPWYSSYIKFKMLLAPYFLIIALLSISILIVAAIPMSQHISHKLKAKKR